MSELLHHDDDAIDLKRPNDIDGSRMVMNSQPDKDSLYSEEDPQNFNNGYENCYTNTTTFLATTSKGMQCPCPQ